MFEKVGITSKLFHKPMQLTVTPDIFLDHSNSPVSASSLETTELSPPKSLLA